MDRRRKKKQGSQRNIERKNDCSVADDFVKENVRSWLKLSISRNEIPPMIPMYSSRLKQSKWIPRKRKGKKVEVANQTNQDIIKTHMQKQESPDQAKAIQTGTNTKSIITGLDITRYCLIFSRQPANNLDTIGTAIAHLQLAKIVGIIINFRLLSIWWGVASISSRVRRRSRTVLHWTLNMGIVEHSPPRPLSASTFWLLRRRTAVGGSPRIVGWSRRCSIFWLGIIGRELVGIWRWWRLRHLGRRGPLRRHRRICARWISTRRR